MDDMMWAAYENAKATTKAFERMFKLEEENFKLRAEVKAHEDRIDNMFQANMKSIGDTLSVMLK